MSDLSDLKAAQFMLGPLYCDYIWQERVKANPPTPSKMHIPFKWQPDTKIIDIKTKRKR